jgi:hypothetical protein
MFPMNGGKSIAHFEKLSQENTYMTSVGSLKIHSLKPWIWNVYWQTGQFIFMDSHFRLQMFPTDYVNL